MVLFFTAYFLGDYSEERSGAAAGAAAWPTAVRSRQAGDSNTPGVGSFFKVLPIKLTWQFCLKVAP